MKLHSNEHLKEWLQISDETKRNLFANTGVAVGLPPNAIEKDWWVVKTLSLISTMKCAGSLIFKGGTSLSKGWNLIKRFSEDIDLALDRSFLNFTDPLSKADIRRLRRESFKYLNGQFVEELRQKFEEAGLSDVDVKPQQLDVHDQDPSVIEVYYTKLTEQDTYMKPGVLVEIGFRSPKEPTSRRSFSSLVSAHYSSQPFADSPVTLDVVNPERTLLEKIFLLHEELQRPKNKRRVSRMSRHLYDIEKIMDAGYFQTAFRDQNLYMDIVAHRRKFTPFSDVDYTRHSPSHIRFIPPNDVYDEWESDYEKMKENMIYGEVLSFRELINKLSDVQARINGLTWSVTLDD